MKVFAEYGDELRAIEAIIKRQSVDGARLQILEAGCGREWYFPLQGIQYDLIGLDLDETALAARTKNKNDLHRAIVGDLRTADIETEAFDVIYCAFVLEHVSGAKMVLDNFARWLRPGGVMILRVPDRDSVHGFLARVTPHWVHVLYYKLAWRLKEAGKPGFPPYPTYYDEVVSRCGFRAFCDARGFELVEEFGVGSYRRGYGWIRGATAAVAAMFNALSFGRIHSKFVDLTFVARKPVGCAPAAAAAIASAVLPG
jgi:SAM-dependent methyltransferase